MIQHPAFTIQSIEPYFLEERFDPNLTFETPFSTTISSFVTLLVRVQDTDGAVGWGEIWCNFPRFGGPYRARIVSDMIAPALHKQELTSVEQTFQRLTQQLRLPVIQSGDPGAFAQAIAGVDIALWDLAAKRAKQPLWKLLGGVSNEIKPYASFGFVRDPVPAVEQAHDRGFRSFKIRALQDVSRYVKALEMIRDRIGTDAGLAVDANQSWPIDRAADMANELGGFDLMWLEEPLPADAPQAMWSHVATTAPMPLAAGENLSGPAGFGPYLQSGAVSIFQPDLAKWGGFSGVLPLSRSIRAAGYRCYPHFFGGAIGQLASAHLLAAIGGDGLLEYGAQPYPVTLRDALVPFPPLQNGTWQLNDNPGLGADPPPDLVAHYRVNT